MKMFVNTGALPYAVTVTLYSHRSLSISSSLAVFLCSWVCSGSPVQSGIDAHRFFVNPMVLKLAGVGKTCFVTVNIEL